MLQGVALVVTPDMYFFQMERVPVVRRIVKLDATRLARVNAILVTQDMYSFQMDRVRIVLQSVYLHAKC